MSVPTRTLAPLPQRNLRALLLLVLLPASLLAATRQPDIRIPLESLGYSQFPPPVLSSGASILTLDYVDDRHMLVTFSVRRLLKRIADDPPEDLDRTIDAVLLELPTGNVLARTSWRLHDPAQYLWPLGNGHFLLRIRDRLTTISPLKDLKSGEPDANAFKEHPLLSSPRPIGAVLLSPDSSLLILETLDRRPRSEPERSPSPGTQAYAAAQVAKAAAQAEALKRAEEKPVGNHAPVQVHFFRLLTKEATGELFAQASGGLGARTLVTIPADSAGFLSILDEGRQHWAFNYNLYRGKVQELSPFDSTCHPHPILVSRSEFIAFGCRSGSQPQMFGGFNLRGEQMWEQAIPETYLNPGFSFAPAAGRFAFGRVITSAVVGDATSLTVDASSTEIVSVFQTETGKQLLRLDCSPVLSAGQNFTLSPDGSELALIRNSVIEIHRLPPLSGKDREAVAMAAALAPEPSEGPVLLTAPLTNATARAATSAGTPVATPPPPPPTRPPTPPPPPPRSHPARRPPHRPTHRHRRQRHRHRIRGRREQHTHSRRRNPSQRRHRPGTIIPSPIPLRHPTHTSPNPHPERRPPTPDREPP
jgi:hypothetical protein